MTKRQKQGNTGKNVSFGYISSNHMMDDSPNNSMLRLRNSFPVIACNEIPVIAFHMKYWLKRLNFLTGCFE